MMKLKMSDDMEGRRRIAILGSTGSIGTQALDVVRQHRDLFEVEVLVANNSVDLLAAQAVEFDVNSVVICNEDHYDKLASMLQPQGIKVFSGISSACSLVAGDNVDIVLASMVGFSGLEPTVAAIRGGKAVALANKETLVAAGALVTSLAKSCGVPLLPVDSEHSAIFQCLQGSSGNPIEKIHLTASGGPFRNWDKESIAAATRESALRHPNWNMGAKVTIDSATMMNKGLEVIEAKWLFNVSPDRINVVVHPESIIHSMVEYADGAVIAQLGHPDMREPIQYALGYPARLSLNNRRLDFAALASLSFQAPDTDRFPCLALAYEAIRRGGNVPCAMNAANEVAVKAYLEDRIGFYDIAALVGETMSGIDFEAAPSLEDIFATNADARKLAETTLAEMLKK